MGGGPRTALDPVGLFKGKPTTPEPIDPAKVAADSLNAQLAAAPDVYKANAEYQPKYAALDQQILYDSLMGTAGAPGLLDMYGKASQQIGGQEADANTLQRTSDIADVARLGPQARAAYMAANPELARMMGGLQTNIAGQRDATYGRVTPSWAGAGDLTATRAEASSLNPMLMKQAGDQLALNGQLSTEDQRAAQQSARSAYAARGLNDSNGAIGAEILNTDSLMRQRRSEAQQFAGGLDTAATALNQGNADAVNRAALARYTTGADLSRSNSALDLQAQLSNLDYSRANTNDQFGREFQLASMLQGQAQDPFQMVLGRSGAPAAAAGAAGAASYTQGAGPKLFDPFNNSLMQIYAGNAANATAASVAAGNNQSSTQGALIGGGGTILVAL